MSASTSGHVFFKIAYQYYEYYNEAFGVEVYFMILKKLRMDDRQFTLGRSRLTFWRPLRPMLIRRPYSRFITPDVEYQTMHNFIDTCKNDTQENVL